MIDQRPLVIKFGGVIFNNTTQLNTLLAACADIRKQRPLVIVHGGGTQITTQLQALGLQATNTADKPGGQRRTTPEQIPVIAGVLAGDLNSALCCQAQQTGLNAVGLTLFDGHSTYCDLDHSRGAVGIPQPDQPQLLEHLLACGFTPVLSSLGADTSGVRLNVNADLAAAAIAQLLQADLLLLTDVAGILTANGQLIPAIDQHQAADLIRTGVVAGGMQVKLEAALDVARISRRSIAVAGWQNASDLVALAQGHHIGTRINYR